MVTRIILDTDIGTYYDDAFATLLAAVSPELQVEGVTTVYGDAHLRARIARKVLDVAGRPDIPVFAGVSKPMRGYGLMFGWEGTNILTDQDTDLKVEPQHAVDFIIDTIMANPKEITVITLGAVSNVALAIVKEPRIVENIKELVIMATVIVPIVDPKGVRRSPREEYNFNNDQIAAEIVMRSGMRITLCPVDVTLKVPMSDDQRRRVAEAGNPVSKLVTDILDVWPWQEKHIYYTVGIPTEHTAIWLHDPLTVALVIDRTLCKTWPLNIAVEYPQVPVEHDMIIYSDVLRTVPKKLPPNMDVCLEVEAERFTEFFTERMINAQPGRNGHV